MHDDAGGFQSFTSCASGCGPLVVRTGLRRLTPDQEQGPREQKQDAQQEPAKPVSLSYAASTPRVGKSSQLSVIWS